MTQQFLGGLQYASEQDICSRGDVLNGYALKSAIRK